MTGTLQSIPLSTRAQRTLPSPISWLMKKTIEDPEILSLAAGFVDQQTLPDDLIQDAITKVFSQPATAKASLQYGATSGLQKLRRLHAKRLESQGLKNVDPENLLISNGGQQSLFTITDVLVDPGDVVLVEDPTYFVYMDVVRSSGARVLGVTTDDEGIVPESLLERFEQLHREGIRDRLRILYVMSYYSNPKGCNMSYERRKRIYEIFKAECERGGNFALVEDASYYDLCLEGKQEPYIKSFEPENELICVTGTFSKALAPGLRLGWAYLPPEIHEACARQKGNQDFGSSNLSQNILAALLESGGYEVAAARFRKVYLDKRNALLEALKEYWPADTQILYPYGGLYVWVQLPGINTDPGSDFFNAVLKEKVLYVPGFYCFCDETQLPKPTNSMRTCYGVIEIDPMREAVRRMGKAIAQFKK